MQAYKGKISYNLPLMFFPVAMTIAVILDHVFYEASLDLSLIYLFWIIFLPILLIPIFYKLKISETTISESFMGFHNFTLNSLEVQKINYGKVGMYGGINPSRPITHGNGLAILASIQGVPKVIGISEELYGKEALEVARRVLESSNNLGVNLP